MTGPSKGNNILRINIECDIITSILYNSIDHIYATHSKFYKAFVILLYFVIIYTMQCASIYLQ